MADAPRILQIRLEEPDESGVGIVIEFGNKSITRKVPIGHGISRISAILNDKGQLVDVELITEKT